MRKQFINLESPLSQAIHGLVRTMRRKRSSTPRSSNRYMHLLALIEEHDGSRSSELAELMDIRPSSLTEMLSNLERDDMISRKQDENDMRVIRIYIEDVGKKHLEAVKSSVNDFFEGILTPEEETTFIELSNKLAQGLTERCAELGDECKHHRHKHRKHHGDSKPPRSRNGKHRDQHRGHRGRKNREMHEDVDETTDTGSNN